MRRRRNSRDVLAVSLFPFLAVLICTLGVLIVLLVLAVKSADTQAAEARAESEAEIDSQLQVIESAELARELQIDGLSMVRPEAVNRLNEARATRSHYESELQSMDREARALAEQLLDLELQRKGLLAEPISDEETSQLKAQIAKAKKTLDEKREKASVAGPVTWSIVPHHGGGATYRRPIFIECTADEIVLHAVGIRLKKNEFQSPLYPGNMLDVALLTIREYWQKYDLDGGEGKAYPLLVVRPDGTESYSAAKEAMKSWDDEFGYELVEADKVFNFGEVDQELAQEVRAAIEKARVRQRRIVQQHRVQQRKVRQAFEFKSQSRPGLTVSGTHGGFVHNGVQSASATDFESEPSGAGGSGDLDSAGGAWGEGGEQRGSADENTSQQSALSDAGSPGGEQAAGQLSGATESLEGGNKEKTSETESTQATESLADSRGEGWALPTRTAGATAYLRPIRLLCDADRLTLRTTTVQKQISFHAPTLDGTKAAVDPLVEEIWRQIDDWGVAGTNGYWKPQLRITVAPGGQARFAMLRGLLAESGLVIQEAQHGNP